LNTHNCHPQATCTNTPGNFICNCIEGFEGDGFSCEGIFTFFFLNWVILICSLIDLDECVLNTHNCHTQAKCSNTPGSFTCDCKGGYSGNGFVCDGMVFIQY